MLGRNWLHKIKLNWRKIQRVCKPRLHSLLEQYSDLFATLKKGNTFTKLEAYQQFVLDEESRKYVVISTHKGLYCYTRWGLLCPRR